MGRILNFAMISNNQEMAEEISSIYQGKRPWKIKKQLFLWCICLYLSNLYIVLNKL